MSMILSFLFAFLFATTSSTCQNISSSTYTRISPPNDTSSIPVVVLHGILSSAGQTKNLSDWI